MKSRRKERNTLLYRIRENMSGICNCLIKWRHLHKRTSISTYSYLCVCLFSSFPFSMNNIEKPLSTSLFFPQSEIVNKIYLYLYLGKKKTRKSFGFMFFLPRDVGGHRYPQLSVFFVDLNRFVLVNSSKPCSDICLLCYALFSCEY